MQYVTSTGCKTIEPNLSDSPSHFRFRFSEGSRETQINCPISKVGSSPIRQSMDMKSVAPQVCSIIMGIFI